MISLEMESDEVHVLRAVLSDCVMYTDPDDAPQEYCDTVNELLRKVEVLSALSMGGE